MKIDARHVRFVVPLPAPGRKRLLFVGRANTVQLQETALVIEGHVKKLSFPIVDTFFRTVLRERTTVTVPYSRIVHWKYSPLYVARTVAALVAWGPVLFCLAIWFKPKVDPEGPLVVAGMLAVLGLLETWLILGRLLAPRNRVLFRRADGKLTMIAFRVRTRRRQRAFADLLERNRRTATVTPTPPPAPAPARPQSAWPLALLVAYLLGRHLFPALRGALGVSTLSSARIIGPALVPPAVPVLVRFLCQDGLIVLLASLLWRWSEKRRWTAVVLLVLQALASLIGAEVWWALGIPEPGRPGDFIDLTPYAMASFAFYLVLTAVLAGCPNPTRAADRAADGQVLPGARGGE